MAKKSAMRRKASRRQPKRPQAQQQRWRQKMLLGGVIVLLVIGAGVFLRFRQQRALLPRLQGAVENHYTRGVAGAPVVVKEFSDFT